MGQSFICPLIIVQSEPMPGPGKLLSICIPTYNRKGKLQRLLGNLASEASGFEDEIELCISDNCSTDGTREYLETVVAKGQFSAKFNFNSRNEGFDRNLLCAVYLATGKFIWFFGDDDLILEGKLNGFISFLKQQLSDADTKRTDIIYILDPKSVEVHPRSSVHDLVVHPYGFISGLVIRSEPFLGLDKTIVEAGVGTRYVHAWILINMGIVNPAVQISVYPYILKPTLYSPNSWRMLSIELVPLRGASLLRFKTLRRILGKPMFWRDIPRLFSSAARFTFLLFFMPLCEREFRPGNKEPIKVSFFMGTYSIFGLALYLYRELLWALPNNIINILFLLVISLLKRVGLTAYSYEHWVETWGKPIPNQ